MAGTYYEKYARINLTTGEIAVEQWKPELARGFIGGRGLGAKLLYDTGAASADPLSPENKLIFITGPMTAAAVPSAGRYSVVTKSPLTGMLASSTAGGVWGTKLKRAGWDAIVVEGAASEWCYISVEDDAIALHSAAEYTGTLSGELDDRLKAVYGTDASVLNIGPAGENKVLLSAVMSDKSRASGKSGIGAVMGSKKLKAIVVKAAHKVPGSVADEAKLAEAARRVMTVMRSAETVGKSLTPPAQNHSGKPAACRGCPIACGNDKVSGHERELLWMFGANRGGADRNTIDEFTLLCNAYGLDVISTIGTIAAAAELHQRGVIKEVCTNMQPAEWISRISRPETDFDRLLSAGAARLCAHYGVTDFSVSFRKRKPPHGEICAADGSRSDSAEAESAKARQDLTAVIDSMGYCLFTANALGAQEYADLLNAATGTAWTAHELLEIGGRICGLEKAFNAASVSEAEKQ